MVKINKIYTRSGDDGTTGLIGGSRVAKDSLRISAVGEVDELNAFIGAARTLAEKSSPKIAAQLKIIQNELFDIGAVLATESSKEAPAKGGKSVNVEEIQITRIEAYIAELTASTSELRSFVLPGGSELNSALHIARAVCRRSERCVLSLSRKEPVEQTLIKYINRLSDLLFAMARAAVNEKEEYLWEPGKK